MTSGVTAHTNLVRRGAAASRAAASPSRADVTLAPMGRAAFALSPCLALILIAACGAIKNPEVDAGIDTPDADLGGDATVVTEAALFGGAIGARVGDIDIVSMLPNNEVLAMGKTDASGAATIRVYPGGTVTAVYRHTVDMGADLITWVGVQPGDTLTFGSRQFSTSGHPNTILGSVTYSWPAQAGATSYNIFSSCTGIGVGGTTTSVASNEGSNCHREPMDVLYGAFGNNGLTHYSFRSNVAFMSGGVIAAGGWSAAQTGSISITGLPPEIVSLNGTFNTVLDSNREINMVGGYSGTPTGGAFSGSFTWHPTGERTVGTLSMNRQGFSTMRLLDSFASNTLTQTVAAPALPPWVQGGAQASSALRMASWFLVPDASSVYDGQVLRVSWSHTVSGMNHPHQWHFILPPEQTSIAFPQLPSQFNDNLPFPQDNMSATIRVFDVSAITGYDMLRTLPSSTVMCLECAVRAGEVQRVVYTP